MLHQHFFFLYIDENIIKFVRSEQIYTYEFYSWYKFILWAIIIYSIRFLQDDLYGQALLDIVFGRLNLIETAYFGLRHLDDENQTVNRFFNFNCTVENLIGIFTALAGPGHPTFTTMSWCGRHLRHVLWCQILRGRSHQAHWGNYKVNYAREYFSKSRRTNKKNIHPAFAV